MKGSTSTFYGVLASLLIAALGVVQAGCQQEEEAAPGRVVEPEAPGAETGLVDEVGEEELGDEQVGYADDDVLTGTEPPMDETPMDEPVLGAEEAGQDAMTITEETGGDAAVATEEAAQDTADATEEVMEGLGDAVVEVGEETAEAGAAAGAAMDEDTQDAAAGGANEVQVTLDEFTIQMPAQLPPGPTVFNITNTGDVLHNFEIEGQGIEEELAEPLEANESGSLQVDLQAGEYRIYCPVADHAGRGMEMTLQVAEGAG